MQSFDEKSIGPIQGKDDVMVTQKMHITDEQMRTFSNDPRVIECLQKFEFRDVSFKHLAQHVGFTSAEMQMLDLFWEPTFNDSWIYLSQKIVMDDMKYASMYDFHTDVLLSKINGVARYEVNNEYKEISGDDELVRAYVLWREKSGLKKEPHKRGSTPKYYAVRGKTLKLLFMRAGKADTAREYFLKLEELAVLMREFMSGLLRYNSFLEKQLIAEQTKKIIDLEAQTAGLDQREKLLSQFVKARALQGPCGWVYIATTSADFSVNRFKIGITTNLDLRLTGYNGTFTNAMSEVYYCDYFHVRRPRLVEQIIGEALRAHHLIMPARVIQDESYICDLAILHSKVADICILYSAIMNRSVADLDHFHAHVMTPSTSMRREPPASQLMIEMKEVNSNSCFSASSLTTPTESDITDVCTYVINKLVKKIYPAFNFATDKEEMLSAAVVLKWTDIEKCVRDRLARGQKGTFSPNTWRTHFSEILKDAKSVQLKSKNIDRRHSAR